MAHTPEINIDDQFLSEAEKGDWCFVENVSVKPYEEWIEKCVVFKWNRTYPGDTFFDVTLPGSNWTLTEKEDFKGYSHDPITMEVYEQ